MSSANILAVSVFHLEVLKSDTNLLVAAPNELIVTDGIVWVVAWVPW